MREHPGAAALSAVLRGLHRLVARDIGVRVADRTILYRETDFAKEIREITGKRGVDVVIEHVGRDTWDGSVRSLARGGRLVTCGATTGHEVTINLRVLFAKAISLLGSTMANLDNEVRFFSELAGCAVPGDLCALDFQIAAAPAESRAILASVLADVVVEAIVTFPSVQVPSHRILALDVGDVIGLGADPDAVLPLRVDGLHLADVRPARAGSDVACQIVSTAVTTSRNSGTTPVSSPTGPSAPGGLL